MTKPRTPSPRHLLAATALAVALAPFSARATTFTWNVGTATFSTPGSWIPASPAGPPLATDTAQFSLGTIYAPTLTANAINNTMNMSAGTVTLTGSGASRTYTLTTTNVSGGTLALSNLQLIAGVMTVSNGAAVNVSLGNLLSATGLSLGTVASASPSTMTIDGVGSNLTVTATAALGQNGATGNLTFQNGASGTFTSLNTLNSATANSVATILIQSDADVTAGGAFNLGMGTIAGQTSSFTVTGTGSTFTQSGGNSFTVGSTANSTSTVAVANYAVFTTGTGPLTLNKTGTLSVDSANANFNGDVTVLGGKLQLNFGAVTHTALGKTVTITAGGSISSEPDVNFFAGDTVNISGAGSSLSTSGRLYILTGEVINVSAGGAVNIADVFNFGTNGSGTMSVSGIGSSFSSSASSSSVSSIGSGSTGTLTYSNGATGNLTTTIFVGAGNNGTGVFSVLSGSSVSAYAINVGGNGPTSGTLTVSGGSSLAIAADFNIGAASDGTGAVTVSNAFLTQGATTATRVGATIGTGNFSLNSTGSLTIINGNVALGSVNVATGSLSFQSGSLGIRGSQTIGANSILGSALSLDSGVALGLSGTLTINAGSSVTLDGGGLSVGSLVNNGSFAFNSGKLEFIQAITVGPTSPLGNSLTLSTGKTLYLGATATVNSGASITVAGGELDVAAVNNSGSIILQSGIFSYAAPFTNNASGRLFINADQTVAALALISNAGRIQLGGGAAYLGGFSSLINTGLITGAGEIGMPVAFTNTSEVRAEAGNTLLFSAPFVTSLAGNFNLLGGTLEFSHPAILSSTALVTGRGTLIAGDITNGGQFQLSAGTTDIYGNFTNGALGKVIVSGGSTTTFYGPVILAANSSFSVAANSTAVFFGNVSGTSTIGGAGTVDFEAGHSSLASLIATAGIDVQAGASLSAQAFQTSQLTVNGQAGIAASGGVNNVGTSKTSALTLAGAPNAWTGAFDLADNKLIVEADALTKAATLATLQNQVAYGHSHAAGITSSLLAANTTIAVIDNGAFGTGLASFGGQPVDSNSILLGAELLGDANLDGSVNFDDFLILSQNFGQPGNWLRANFINEPTVDFNDFLVLSQHFGQNISGASETATPEQLAAMNTFFASGALPTPEPASVAVLMAAAPLLFRRRRNPR